MRPVVSFPQYNCGRAAGRAAVALCAALATSIVVPPASAMPLPQSDQLVALSVVDQDLADVLSELGDQAGWRVSVSPAVHGRVHGRLPPATATASLDRLARMFGFEWYYDGETVYVSAYGESASKLLALGGVGVDRLSRTLSQLGIADPRWPIRTADEAGLGLAEGPPRYLALIEQTLAALPAPGVRSGEVHVFRGAAASPSL